MFADLGLPLLDASDGTQRDRLVMLLTLGYDAAAVTHTAVGRLTEANRCTIQPIDRQALTSAPGTQQLLRLREGSGFARFTPGQGLQQLTRLNFEASEPMQTQMLASNEALVRGYDIVAVHPKTERIMQQACSSLDVDVITLDLSQRLAFKLRPAVLKAAVDRGIHFEVCYAPVLRDAAGRRHLFSNAQALARITRGQNIILSSGARNAFELRGPYDIINMATLFGLTPAQAKAAISSNAAAVIAHGASRRFLHGAVQVSAAPAPARTLSNQEGGAKAKADDRGGVSDAAASKSGNKRRRQK